MLSDKTNFQSVLNVDLHGIPTLVGKLECLQAQFTYLKLSGDSLENKPVIKSQASEFNNDSSQASPLQPGVYIDNSTDILKPSEPEENTRTILKPTR